MSAPRPAARVPAIRRLPAYGLALLLAACGPTDAGSTPEPPQDTTRTVLVHFTRDEEPVPVERRIPETRQVLRATLEAQLRGPTADERATGLTSFFSEATAGLLNQVTLDEQGRAIIDFRDLRPVIPNASSSAGSQILLGELDATVFQFPNVQSVEYRIDGSCEVFWEWLQVGGCPVVERPGE
jgi:hypothetical protein